jgi:hypothetical protein
MRRLLLVVVAAVWCSTACGVLKPPDHLPVGGGIGGTGGGGGGGIQSTTPPDLTPLLAAVFGASPNKLLADVANTKLELDPTVKDPLTGLASCADFISYCYAPPNITVSECFARARKCETTEPWTESSPCCPTQCQTAYDDEVGRGMGHVQALEKVLFREPDCYPGARAALEGQ